MLTNKKVSKKVGFQLTDENPNKDFENKRLLNYKLNLELLQKAKQSAQQIVMHLIEEEVDEGYLEKQLLFITPEQYDDTALERALFGICGHPLCKNKIDNYFSDQQFIIRQNKVYDVTERKNFCDGKCYEAYLIIRGQIPQTPLHSRISDKELHTMKISIPALSCLKGEHGKLVDVTGINKGHEDAASPQSSKNSDPQALDLTTDITLDYSKPPKGILKKHPKECHEIADNDEVQDAIAQNLANISLNEQNHNESTPLNQDLISEQDHFSSVYQIENFLRQWMTFESLVFILGEQYVRGMMEDLGEVWEDYGSSREMCLELEAKGKYITLCKKLNATEIKEEFEDMQDIKDDNQPERLPLPDYEQLQDDAQRFSNIVKCFYEGKEYTEDPPKLDTILEELDEQIPSKKEETKGPLKERPIKKIKGIDEDPPIEDPTRLFTFPLIDSCEQNTWRRKIFEEKLKPSLATHVHHLSLCDSKIRSLMSFLIDTFELSPLNIVLNPRQWRVVSLILLKMLTVRYPAVSLSFTQDDGLQYISSALEAAGLDPLYLDRVLTYATEIIYILKKHSGNNPPESYQPELANDQNPTSAEDEQQTVVFKDLDIPRQVDISKSTSSYELD